MVAVPRGIDRKDPVIPSTFSFKKSEPLGMAPSHITTRMTLHFEDRGSLFKAVFATGILGRGATPKWTSSKCFILIRYSLSQGWHSLTLDILIPRAVLCNNDVDIKGLGSVSPFPKFCSAPPPLFRYPNPNKAREDAIRWQDLGCSRLPFERYPDWFLWCWLIYAEIQGLMEFGLSSLVGIFFVKALGMGVFPSDPLSGNPLKGDFLG